MRNVACDGLSSHVWSYCLGYYTDKCKMGKKKALLWCVLHYDGINGALFEKSCDTGNKETSLAHVQIYDALSVLPGRQMNYHTVHT
jgi:hypothetical protein